MRTPNSQPRKKLRISPSSSANVDFGDIFDTTILEQDFFKDTDDNKTQHKCNCKNSKCLKLYCDCFANGITCSSNCSCLNCNNLTGYEKEITFAKNIILKRNPVAFDKKIVHGTMHSRGCKCKKTRCLKKYCECFQAGVQCTQNCECLGCENGKDGIYDTSKNNEMFSLLTAI